MKIFNAIILAWVLAAAVFPQNGGGANSSGADRVEDGKILERVKFAYPEYEGVKNLATLVAKEDYTEATSAAFDTERIVYASGGLKVAAYVYRSKVFKSNQPVIVFNRGGYVRGSIAPEFAHVFRRFAMRGFAVVAPLYRGSDGSEGRDEVGGDDLVDLTSVLPLIKNLEFADEKNIFLYGESRGGMMVYQAIRDGFPANAAATYGSFSDFDALVEANASQYLPLLRSIWADYDARKQEIAVKRSAIKWAEKIGVPLLLMHGGEDRTLDPMHTLRLAAKLQELKKPYELIIFGGDNHSIRRNQVDRDARASAWFEKYLKK